MKTYPYRQRTPEKMAFGQRLRSARLADDLTQIELARRTRITQRRISLFETGNELPRERELRRLQRVFPGLSIPAPRRRQAEPGTLPFAEIGTRIKIARLESGLTQQQIADELGLNQRSISNWERGRTLPAAENLPAFLGAYRLDDTTRRMVESAVADRYSR